MNNFIKTKYWIFILILGFILLMPHAVLSGSEEEVTLNLFVRDSQGNIVKNVNFQVYEQRQNINGNNYLGTKLKSGKIDASGYERVSFKLKDPSVNNFAIRYYQDSHDACKFIKWNLYFTAGRSHDVELNLSSVRVVLQGASGELLKDFKFNIYTAIEDINGNKVPSDKIWRNKKTGIDGQSLFYLTSGNYFLTFEYPGLKNIEQAEHFFTVTKDQQTDLVIPISVIRFAIRDWSGHLNENSKFKLYKKEKILNTSDYQYVGSFSTGSAGYDILYLPSGDYKIIYKDSFGKYTQITNFYLAENTHLEIINNLESFRLKVVNVDNKRIEGRNVKIYKEYANGKDLKSFEGKTDKRGYVQSGLIGSGNYYAIIDSDYGDVFYKTGLFYFSDSNNNDNDDVDYEFREVRYILSRARIYITDKNNGKIKNQVFTIFNYQTDSKGKTKLGKEVATFITNNSGYKEIDLAPGRYLIKLSGQETIYPIQIQASKLNQIYVNLNYLGLVVDQLSQTETAEINSYIIQDSLYAADSDNDGLADFEEIYIYGTNPYAADSDNDGFSDKLEIKNNYNPNGYGFYYYHNFSYGKPRVNSPTIEQQSAANLKNELIKRIGYLRVHANDWHTLVNSYVYGGYSIEEIKNTLVYGPGMVHPTISAEAWRRR